MDRRRLGQTGLYVTCLGFGGIPIQRLSAAEAVALVQEVVAQGVNFIDSARGYTTSEERIGQALSKGLRSQVYLATKTMARDAQGFQADLERSLANFQTDYIDLYQFHNVRSYEAWQQIIGPGGAMEVALQAKKDGLIRHIGITGHVCDVLCTIMESTDLLETVQVPFNPVETKPMERLLGLAQEQDLGLIVMKPLAGGAINRVDLALRWILNHPVTVAIPGMGSSQELHQNLEVAEDLRPLTQAEEAELAELVAQLGEDFCRRCEYCLPCPNGIDIPSLFVLEGYALRYNLGQWAQDRYQATAIKPDVCAQCGICESRCPYQLPIQDKLKRVRALFEE